MQNNKPYTKLENEIIKTLLYFDIFNYPLKSEEIFRFLGTNGVTEKDVYCSLTTLSEHNQLFYKQGFYSLQPNERNIYRRIKGNQQAEVYLEIAKQQGKRIANFPFVRGVMVSGSLSKGYMDADSDIDFFIVTEPNRLWIARTLLVLYKRLFLFNSHKYFCVNYFIDTDHLEIEEKNRFTATELATVIPVYNTENYAKLLLANTWLKDFFPNFKSRYTSLTENFKPSKKKLLFEKCLNPFAKHLDNFFMKMTLRRWKKLYEKQYEQADFKIAFKTERYVSKNHPKYYQRTVMDRYQEKIKEFSKQPDKISSI